VLLDDLEGTGSRVSGFLQLVNVQSLWVVARTQEMEHPLTPEGLKRMQEDKVSKETIEKRS